MHMPSVVVVNPSEGPSVALFDKTTLNFMVSIMAASVIDQIKNMPTTQEGGTRPIGGAGQLLLLQVSWADHGHMNALQSQVQFLYAWVEAVINDYVTSAIYLMSDNQIALVAQALSSYQIYKTKVVEWQKDTDGQTVGINTEFAKKDWTDKNRRLLSLIAVNT